MTVEESNTMLVVAWDLPSAMHLRLCTILESPRGYETVAILKSSNERLTAIAKNRKIAARFNE